MLGEHGADGLGLGVVVVAERGLFDHDVAEPHLVEQVAGELAAGAGKVRAVRRMRGDHPPHPHLGQHGEREHQGQEQQHDGHSPSSLSPRIANVATRTISAGRGPG